MKFVPLIWAGLWRHPLRTTLTALSVIAAFLVLGLLENASASMNSMAASQRPDRLHVHAKHGGWLPMSHLPQIESVAGVLAVAQDIPPGGYYREPKNGFGVLWTNAETIFTVMPEFQASAENRDMLRRTRHGVLVSEALADRFDWKVGDRVTINSPSNLRKDGTELWQFEIVGLFQIPQFRPNCCVIENYDYFSESSVDHGGQVGEFMVRVRDPREAAAIAIAIDQLFQNSSAETRTNQESGSDFLRAMPVTLIMRIAMIAGFVIILVVTIATALQSLRERAPEFGVLKAVGFSNGSILAFVVGEFAALILTAALVGFGAAGVLVRLVVPPPFGGEIQSAAVYWAILAAVAVTAFASLVPVWRVVRLDAARILAGL